MGPVELPIADAATCLIVMIGAHQMPDGPPLPARGDVNHLYEEIGLDVHVQDSLDGENWHTIARAGDELPYEQGGGWSKWTRDFRLSTPLGSSARLAYRSAPYRVTRFQGGLLAKRHLDPTGARTLLASLDVQIGVRCLPSR